MMKAICPKCKTEYIMGKNGTVDGCDSCTGVLRDRLGYAWYPGEKFQRYLENGTHKIVTVRRDKAFGKKK